MAVVDESFERLPRVSQGDASVVGDVTACVARIGVVAGSERVGRVDDVAVDVVDLKPSSAPVEGRPYPRGTVVGVPDLGGDEQVLTRDRARGQGLWNASPTASSLR